MAETALNPIKSYKVSFDSMEPAIISGSDVIGDTTYYSTHKPARWDVVVFFLAPDSGRFVKRIIGLPGETISLTPEGPKINGVLEPVPSTLKGQFASFKKHPEHKFGLQPFKVPADSVFVIGDNSDVFVADSRANGPVPIRNLEARVLAAVHTKWME